MNRKLLADCIMGDLVRAVEKLQKCRDFAYLMPEVRVNLVYAMPGAKSVKEVAGVDGRITVVNGYPHASGLPSWGVSDHMARLILEARNYKGEINAGINFKCDESIIALVKEYAESKSVGYGWIDRTIEPDEFSRVDRSSIPWKVKYLIATYKELPMLFYEGDGWGKEPLFFALGGSATEVVNRAMEIAGMYSRKIRA